MQLVFQLCQPSFLSGRGKGGVLHLPGELALQVLKLSSHLVPQSAFHLPGEIVLQKLELGFQLVPLNGGSVTITVEPDRGYEVGDVTVTDRDGDTVRVTANRDGTYTFEQPRGRVTIEVTFVPTGTATFFTDVPESFWAYNEIKWAYDNGYVNGTSATTFSPNSSISRQQVWMILARLSGADPANMAEARTWAMENGISDGTTPGNAVTRQQLVALLFRYATMMGYVNDQRADLSIYPDASAVASYAVEPMQWSVANSIVAGTSDGTLNPTGTATRAQFAVILYRFWSQIG